MIIEIKKPAVEQLFSMSNSGGRKFIGQTARKNYPAFSFFFFFGFFFSFFEGTFPGIATSC
jgi:hypothetical protein